jgi:heme/copper-type cytochrome/quinol oxidase subunit 2
VQFSDFIYTLYEHLHYYSAVELLIITSYRKMVKSNKERTTDKGRNTSILIVVTYIPYILIEIKYIPSKTLQHYSSAGTGENSGALTRIVMIYKPISIYKTHLRKCCSQGEVNKAKTFQRCLPSSVANAQTYRFRASFILLDD